ncbi:MAG: hypothetical protein NTX22_07805 [Ignavibacteriales bacterium]|nr:hypothetical protein [Ignavibacteriales bacterium]
MGRIIYWAIIRTAIVIPALWIMMGYVHFQFLWFVVFLSIYVIILHPAIVQYRKFELDNKEIIESTLCSSCKSFDKSAVLCMKYDQHPTLENLPCEGVDWEPISSINYEEEKQN